jgi:transketolase
MAKPIFRISITRGGNMHFGIREHGMGSVLTDEFVRSGDPMVATFFVFTDYMRPAHGD